MTRPEKFISSIALMNFLALITASIWLGGNALQGKVEDGRYWIGEDNKLREVSAGTYWFSLLHVGSVFLTHPMGMFAGWRGHRRAKNARGPKA
jgi:hypothetical protein